MLLVYIIVIYSDNIEMIGENEILGKWKMFRKEKFIELVFKC